MRDPLRIEPLLILLGAVWHQRPDERFGQFLMNLSRDENGDFQDVWEWDIVEFTEALRRREAKL